MALRDQPYLPLYIQDFITDEKLNECSACANGVYIRLMCLMHKSKLYGAILPRQMPQQMTHQLLRHLPDTLPDDLPNVLPDFCRKYSDIFAPQLVKHLPFSVEEIHAALMELLSEQVLKVHEDVLYQKRMVEDNRLSIKRSKSGKKGAKKTNKIFAAANDAAKAAANDAASLSAKAAANDAANHPAKVSANYEDEDEYNNRENNSETKRVVSTVVRNIGEIEILVFLHGKEWETKEIVDFIQKSEKQFEQLAMNKPILNNKLHLQLLLQKFVKDIQQKGDYKTTPELKKHFINWINRIEEKGTLEGILKGEKNAVAKPISHEEYHNQ